MRFKIMRRIAHAVGFTGFLCFLLIVLTEIGTGRNDPTTIRVAIIKGKKVVRITATGEFEIWDHQIQAIDNFYQKLTEYNGSETAQNWYNTFNNIIETIEIMV